MKNHRDYYRKYLLHTSKGYIKIKKRPYLGYCEICGTKKSLIIFNEIEYLEIRDNEKETIELWRPTIWERRDYDMTFSTMIDSLAESIIEHKPPITTGEDGVKSLQLVDAIINSFEKNAPVKLD